MTLAVGDYINTPEQARRDLLLRRLGPVLVQSACGYPYLVTSAESDCDPALLIKTPGDDYGLDGEDPCCWPWRVLWTSPEDGLPD